jgi:hypothetical protein
LVWRNQFWKKGLYSIGNYFQDNFIRYTAHGYRMKFGKSGGVGFFGNEF